MTATAQLSLNRPEWFQPVPTGTRHYVVALQSLQGERDALVQPRRKPGRTSPH